MGYLPIEDHGVIGDLHTAALVGTDGTIDWLCLPAFDSPSVFCSILDDEKGGHFKLKPLEYARSQQLYLPDTNVLLTRFLSPEGVAEVLDFMPIEPKGEERHQLVRSVRVILGEVTLEAECRPAFDYARREHAVSIGKYGAVFEGPRITLGLATMERIQAELTHDVLVNRYDIEEAAPDGLEGGEGTFSLCSFWLVECLTQAGRLEEARLALEKMFSYANHLGLYAEEIGSSGEALGNFPQAFTHLALISATVHLNHALGHG
jgi:GH15 family glucan-1,4-alpha-glucosidase